MANRRSHNIYFILGEGKVALSSEHALDYVNSGCWADVDVDGDGDGDGDATNDLLTHKYQLRET